jgi:hypothetical protein
MVVQYEHTPARPDPYDNRYAHFISSGSAHLMQLDRPDPFDRARIDVNRADPEQYRMSSDDYGQNAPVQDGREDQGPSVLSKRSHANSDVSDLWSSGALSSVPICVVRTRSITEASARVLTFLCQVCETRPQNPHTHPFCSRYCREEFRHAQSSARVGRDGPDTGMSRAPSMRSPMLLCEVCTFDSRTDAAARPSSPFLSDLQETPQISGRPTGLFSLCYQFGERLLEPSRRE